jgi:hypothetical protein
VIRAPYPTRREPTMLDVITAVFARDRVAEQFARPVRRPAHTPATPRRAPRS